MTLIDFEIYQKIRPWEFMNSAWTKKNKETDAPNIIKFIYRFNEVSLWVQHVILFCDNIRKRATLIEKFVKTAQEFLKLGNFNGAMQIVSAFEGAAVHRLNKTFERVRPGMRKKYSALHILMSNDSSYKLYRESLATYSPPCVPYLGIYLTDLNSMFEVQKNNLSKFPSYVNFNKFVQIYAAMKGVLKYQGGSYSLATVNPIREFILEQLQSYGSVSKETLYEQSFVLEPRDENTSQ